MVFEFSLTVQAVIVVFDNGESIAKNDDVPLSSIDHDVNDVTLTQDVNAHHIVGHDNNFIMLPSP